MKVKIKKRIISSILSLCLVITGIPVSTGAAAEAPPAAMPKLVKTDDPKYKDFSWDEAAYNAIVAKSSDIEEISKLPDYEEFKSLTGYQGITYTTLTKFREIYGTGSDFNAPSDTVTIAVCTNDELDLMSALVNNTAVSETAAEQAYYSKADYVLGAELHYTGTKFMPIGTDTYSFNGSFDGQNFELTGITLKAEKSTDYDGIGYIGLFGYTGSQAVIKNLGITNMTVNMPYAVGADAAFLCGRNNGTIRNCYVNNKFSSVMQISNATAGGISAENYGTIENCYADAWIEIDVQSGSYSEPQPITTVNNGTVSNCYYLKHQYSSYYAANRPALNADVNNNSFVVGWKYSGDTSLINGTGLALYDFLHLSEYIDTFSNGAVIMTNTTDRTGIFYKPSEFEAIIGTGSHFNADYSSFLISKAYLKIENDEEQAIYNAHVNRTIPESDAEYDIWNTAKITGNPYSNNNAKAFYIDFYPVIGKPDQDENGVYLIKTVPNFLWLIRYARNDKAKLMKSLDLSNIVIDYVPNSTFELDGTLTDTSDICSSIDLGVTKCYGLLNLTIKNGKLANQADLSNIYLIGGQYVFDNSNFLQPSYYGGYTQEQSYYIARNIENFHSSMDILLNARSRDWTSMAKNAVKSSFAGKLIINSRTNSGDIYPLAYTCTDCTAYTHFVSNVLTSGIYGMGCNVDRSICRVSVSGSQSNTLYGLGKNVTSCVADSIYNCSDTGIYVFGYDCTDCTFTGTYNGDKTMKTPVKFAYKAVNIAITEKALINGTTNGLTGSSDSHTIFFRGTWDTYIAGNNSNQYLFGSTCNNVTSYGTVNIHSVPERCTATSNYNYISMGLSKIFSESCSIACMGSTVNGVQNSVINFVDCDGIAFTNFIFSVWGGASHSWQYDSETFVVKENRNYSELHLDGNYYLKKVFITDRSYETSEFYNYGDIFAGDNVYINTFSGISSTAYKRAVNFGDIQFRNGNSLTFNLMFNDSYSPAPHSNEYINYGNIVFEKTKNDGIATFYRIAVLGVYQNSRSINYGDLTVNFGDGIGNKSSLTIYHSYGVSVGDLNVSNIKDGIYSVDISGSSYSNYGNINIHDINASTLNVTACFPYAYRNVPVDIRFVGNVNIHDVHCTYSFAYNTFVYKAASYYNSDPVNDNFYSSADINIENITTANTDSRYGVFVHNGIGQYTDSADSFTLSGVTKRGVSSRDIDITVNNIVTVRNINSANQLVFTGCSDFIGDDHGYKHNKGSASFEDMNVKLINYSGIASCHNSYPHEEYINSSDLTITNVTASAESVICGIYSSKDVNQRDILSGISQYCINLGSMDIEINNAPVTIAGISRSIYTNTNNHDNNIVLNRSDIQITGNRNINVSGIQYTPDGSVSASKIFNAINDGTIAVVQTGNGTVNIGGISTACNEIKSTENLADISTNCTSGRIAAICGRTADCVGWINYGNINADNMTGYVSCVIGESSDNITEYGINYGNIPMADSNNTVQTNYIIDLSGNKNAVPINRGTYSTDASISGTSFSASVKINDFDAAALSEQSEAYDRTHSKRIVYTDILMSDFGLRYNNIVTPKYISEAKKLAYNKTNLLEYADHDELKGILKTNVDKFGNYGGFVLICTDNSGDPCIGKNLEALLYDNNIISSENIPYWWSEFDLTNYVTARLLQREIGTDYKLSEINIQSSDSYSTKNGGQSKIQNKSSLIRFQAAADGDDDGIFSENTIVTIVDEYVLVNEFTDIVGQNIRWEVIPAGPEIPEGINDVYLYSEPIITDNASDFRQSIKTLLADETYKGNERSTGTTAELPLQDVGGTTYAVIGYLLSEDGRRTNVIAMRINSTTTDPLGWTTSLVYPTGYEINGSSFDTVSTDAFGGSKSYYDSKKGYEPYETDKTTVEKITATQHDYSYPKYTITQPMLHTTDKDKISTYDISRLETSEVKLGFRVQNVKDYTIKLDSDGEAFYYTEDITDLNGEASEDGTVIIKTVEKVLNSSDFKTKGEAALSNKYIADNPFLYGGTKTITVTGHNASGDELILFVIDLPKSESPENYFKDQSVLRNWIKYHSSEPTDNFSDQPLDISKIAGTYFIGKVVSTLAKSSNYRGDMSGLKKHGDYTEYPEHIYSYADVTAENGETVTYTRNDKIIDFDKLSYKLYNSWSNNSCSVFNNSMAVINDGYTSCYTDLWINDKQVDNLYYASVALPDGTKTDLRFVFDKMDIFIGGEYDHTVTAANGLSITDEMSDVYFTFGSTGKIITFHKGNMPLNELPDAPITFRLYLKHTTLSGEVIKVQLKDFTFSKVLDTEYKLISSKLNKGISTPILSDIPDDLSDNLDTDSNGEIIYNVDYTEIEHIYINDAVEPNCTSSEVEYDYSPLATLQYYNGYSWENVSEADSPYKTTYSFTFEGLQSGYTYNYRIIAQDYNTGENADHVMYITHRINAVTRNKTLTIEFKEDDTETMSLYNDLVNKDGSLSVQVKNMNADQIKMQQTKFYRSNADLNSNYYNISQGDFAVLVNLPVGYTYNVRIIGGSTEGYLKESTVVKGKRLRLPYANSQTIKLVITLEKDNYRSWGVSYDRSLYKSIRQNNI